MSSGPANDAPYRLFDEVTFGAGVIVYPFTNLYGCRIGDRTRVGTFVEIQRGASIGADCKIQSHSFLCDGVRIDNGVFVGHGVLFVNDKTPRVLNAACKPQTDADWDVAPIHVREGASLGSGTVVVGPVTIGEGALVGAGAVVTKDVAPGETVAGVPARKLG